MMNFIKKDILTREEGYDLHNLISQSKLNLSKEKIKDLQYKVLISGLYVFNYGKKINLLDEINSYFNVGLFNDAVQSSYKFFIVSNKKINAFEKVLKYLNINPDKDIVKKAYDNIIYDGKFSSLEKLIKLTNLPLKVDYVKTGLKKLCNEKRYDKINKVYDLLNDNEKQNLVTYLISKKISLKYLENFVVPEKKSLIDVCNQLVSKGDIIYFSKVFKHYKINEKELKKPSKDFLINLINLGRVGEFKLLMKLFKQNINDFLRKYVDDLNVINAVEKNPYSQILFELK